MEEDYSKEKGKDLMDELDKIINNHPKTNKGEVKKVSEDSQYSDSVLELKNIIINHSYSYTYRGLGCSYRDYCYEVYYKDKLVFRGSCSESKGKYAPGPTYYHIKVYRPSKKWEQLLEDIYSEIAF